MYSTCLQEECLTCQLLLLWSFMLKLPHILCLRLILVFLRQELMQPLLAFILFLPSKYQNCRHAPYTPNSFFLLWKHFYFRNDFFYIFILFLGHSITRQFRLAQSSLGTNAILVPLPSKCWHYRLLLSHLALNKFFICFFVVDKRERVLNKFFCLLFCC